MKFIYHFKDESNCVTSLSGEGGGPSGISLVYRSSSTVQYVQYALDVNKVFLDCRLGPTLSCLITEKGKYSNQLLFCNNNKAFWSSQDRGMLHPVGDAKEVEDGGGWRGKKCLVNRELAGVEVG